MSLYNRFPLTPQSVQRCRIIGICIFAAAFFLPACKFIGTRSELINIGTYSGWKCAWFSLVLVILPETYESPFLLAVFGGLINPMIVAYLACYRPRFARTRRILTWAICACILSTWVFFAINQFLPLIGHIMWIAGIALILAGEFSTQPSEPLPG
jgi:hypothetical protein